MPISVGSATTRRLDATRRAWRALPKDLKNTIRKAQRSELNPIWRQEMAASLAAHATTSLHSVVFKTGTRVSAGLPLSLVAGGGSRKMRGGATADRLDTVVEFGTKRRGRFTRYNRKARGATTKTAVERRANEQLPAFQANGWIVYPAVSQAIPRIIGSWVHAINERIDDAANGKG